jgi:hypothetical protein
VFSVQQFLDPRASLGETALHRPLKFESRPPDVVARVAVAATVTATGGDGDGGWRWRGWR